uniref:Glycoprotein n=3 Tax=root TaxID=1 RepID=A0A126LAW6_HUMAN|nr:glycoprotein [Homo sapiens]ARM07001.2 U20 [Human betaherpesvirus 6]QOI14944.1 membrane protein U20 [Human betaherpesvirus 6A]ARM07992.2 U20 [Human betaherpesvirus 6]ARM09086.2 hypothetical protein [Human betaherpesvirus 6]
MITVFAACLFQCVSSLPAKLYIKTTLAEGIGKLQTVIGIDNDIVFAYERLYEDLTLLNHTVVGETLFDLTGNLEEGKNSTVDRFLGHVVIREFHRLHAGLQYVSLQNFSLSELVCFVNNNTQLSGSYVFLAGNTTYVQIDLFNENRGFVHDLINLNILQNRSLHVLSFYARRFCVEDILNFYGKVVFGDSRHRPPQVFSKRDTGLLVCTARRYRPIGTNIQWSLQNQTVSDDHMTDDFIRTEIAGQLLYSYERALSRALSMTQRNFSCEITHKLLVTPALLTREDAFSFKGFVNPVKQSEDMFPRHNFPAPHRKKFNKLQLLWIFTVIPIAAGCMFVYMLTRYILFFVSGGCSLNPNRVLKRRRRNDEVPMVIMEVEYCNYEADDYMELHSVQKVRDNSIAVVCGNNSFDIERQSKISRNF